MDLRWIVAIGFAVLILVAAIAGRVLYETLMLLHRTIESIRTELVSVKDTVEELRHSSTSLEGLVGGFRCNVPEQEED